MKKIIENDYLITSLKKIVIIFCGILNLVILNRYLGPNIRGEYNYILNATNLIITSLNLGVTFSYSYFKRKSKENDKENLNNFIMLILFQFLINSLVMILILVFTNQSLIKMIFIIVPVSVLRLQLNYISMVEELKKQSFRCILGSIINTLLIIVLCIFFERKLIYIIYIYILKEMITSILFFKTLDLRLEKRHVNIKKWFEILKFGIVPTVTAIMIAFNYKLDVIIIKYMGIDFYWIGLYTTGVALAEYAWIIPDIFKDVMINKTSKSDSIEKLTFSLRVSSTVLLIIYIILLLFGERIIVLLFGIEYKDAYYVTRIIFLGVFSMIYCKILGTLYISKGEWKIYSLTLIMSVILNILLNYIFIPKYHILGAAIATILSYTLAGVVFLFDFKIKYKLKYSDLLFLNKEDIKRINVIYKGRD